MSSVSTLWARRRRHPDRWIFCIDLFTCKGDLGGHPQVGQFRAAVRDTVASLALARLVYLDGRDLLPDPLDLNSYLVHPATSRIETIASHVIHRMRAVVD